MTNHLFLGLAVSGLTKTSYSWSVIKVHPAQVHGLVAAVEADVALLGLARVAGRTDHQALDVGQDAPRSRSPSPPPSSPRRSPLTTDQPSSVLRLS